MFDGNTFQELLCIIIPIANDVFFEPVEHFSVTLSCPSNNVMLDEVNTSATIFIKSTSTDAGDKYAVEPLYKGHAGTMKIVLYTPLFRG